MPELPEVETTKLSLAPLIGARVTDVAVHQPRLREIMPDDLDRLIGATLIDVTRRAKYLILTFAQGDYHEHLVVHLGMSGSLQQYHDTPKRKHDHLMMGFGDITLHYHDPRRFGMIVWQKDSTKYFAKLGLEPLSDEFSADYLWQICQTRTRPIKSIIMDQAVVVGVGNIYATESLFLSRIHPATSANLLNYEQIKTLVAHIKSILQKAITQGGSTLKDFTVGAGKAGYFTQTLYAYGRHGKPCINCNLPLETIKIQGRASVFCPSCQSLPPKIAEHSLLN